MGHYSVLTIDGVSFSYKYEIPAFLALLFTDGDFYRNVPDHPLFDDDDRTRWVGYTTTAGVARERLDGAGFTYAFFGEIVETLAQDIDTACVQLLLDPPVTGLSPVHDESDEEHSRTYTRAHDLVAQAAARRGREQIAAFAAKLKVDLAATYPPRYIDGRSIDVSELPWGLLTDREWGLLTPLVGTGGGDEARPEVDVAALRVAELFAEGSECPREVADLLLARVLVEVADAEAEVHLDLTDLDLYDGHDFAGQPSRLAVELVRRVDIYNRAFSVLVDNRDEVRRQAFFVELEGLLRDFPAAKTADEKGRVLEQLVASIFDGHPSFTISEKRLNLGDQEIDLVVRNHVENAFWYALSTPLILVECKNWSSAVGTSEVRVFRDKLGDHSRARLGIFVAMGGFSSKVDQLQVRSEARHDYLVVLTGQNIRELVDERLDVVEWLTRHVSALH